jgi:hypothetical protein
MSEELKLCPLCGSESVILANGAIRCTKIGCPLYDIHGHIFIDSWNTRPLEDALQAELDEFMEKLTRIFVRAERLNSHPKVKLTWEIVKEDLLSEFPELQED